MSDLRRRKTARTRLNLARSLSQALSEKDLSTVSVRDLCREAEISEATFFNYFPRKQDLMGYVASLWLLELGWHVQAAADKGRGLQVVEQLFAHSAKTCVRQPGVFRELLIWVAQGGTPASVGQLDALERRLVFPALENIEHVPLQGVDVWMLPQLQAAIEQKVLPENTLLPTLLHSLLSILFGVPLTLLAVDPARVAGMYRQQLSILWAGARAVATAR